MFERNAFLEELQKVQWPHISFPKWNPLCFQHAHKLRARNAVKFLGIKTNRTDVIRRLPIVIQSQNIEGIVLLKPLCKCSHEFCTNGIEFFKFFQLCLCNRCLQFGHAKIAPDNIRDVCVLRIGNYGLTMIANHLEPKCQFRILRHTQSPLSALNSLVHIKTEHSNIADCSNRPSLPLRPPRLCTVFDHLEFVFSRDLHDLIHVCRDSKLINHENRLCARSESLSNRLWVKTSCG